MYAGHFVTHMKSVCHIPFCNRHACLFSAKFYCYQHIGMKKQMRRGMRKRSSSSDIQHSDMPPEIILPAQSTEPVPEEDTSPDGIQAKLNRTPERIEFHTESEMEESELEQTQHNLSASFLDLADIDNMPSDSDEYVV